MTFQTQLGLLLLDLAHAALLRLVCGVGEPEVGLDVADVDLRLAVLDGRRRHGLLDLSLLRRLDLLLVLGVDEHEGDSVTVALVPVDDAHVAVDDAQVAAGCDVTQADVGVPAHETPVPFCTQEFESPQGPGVVSYRACLEENIVWVLADPGLWQCEALVDVAVEKTQHVATVGEAGVFHAHITGRDWKECPQGLLERGVYSVYSVFD